jgi:ubiquinone/menaquinone biosynthesis C-methylase UbiE
MRRLGVVDGAGEGIIGCMGLYEDRILPRIQDAAMGRRQCQPIRARICEGLEGSVVELGFGTGLNVPYYPPAVTNVTAVEPSELCMRIAQPRIDASPVPVELGELNGEVLALDLDQFDAALSSWTLCTIPDVAAALAEVRRVLKPGGRLHFVEHGLAPDAKIARWQTRIEPLHKRYAGGCHLSRPIAELIEAAGFELERLDTYYLERELKPMSFTYEGVAVAP